LEGAERAVASGSATCELQPSVDGLDRSRRGVVLEVSQDAVDVPPEGPSEFDQWLQPRPATPRQDRFELFFRILAVLIVPQVDKELPQREPAGDLVVLLAAALAPLQFGGELREGLLVLSLSEKQQPGDFGGYTTATRLLAADLEDETSATGRTLAMASSQAAISRVRRSPGLGNGHPVGK